MEGDRLRDIRIRQANPRQRIIGIGQTGQRAAQDRRQRNILPLIVEDLQEAEDVANLGRVEKSAGGFVVNVDSVGAEHIGEPIGLVPHRAEEDDDVAAFDGRGAGSPASSIFQTFIGGDPSRPINWRIRRATRIAS